VVDQPSRPIHEIARDCLREIGMTETTLSEKLGHPRGTVQQWLSGRARMPDELLTWLLHLADLHRAAPAPQINRRPPGRPSKR
jgi:DNA-binding transcriptional regulator YiaG